MDFKFEFSRNQINKISHQKIVEELEKVAKHFDYKDFRQDDFNRISEINYYTCYREFGSWEKTLLFLKEHLKKSGIDFELTTRRSRYSLEEIFNEIENIWLKSGHRPSRNEWSENSPKISFSTIERRFGGWQEACLKFVEHKSGEIISMQDGVEENKDLLKGEKVDKKEQGITKRVLEKTRTINLSVRLEVLNRDNFRCMFCGRSPATDVGTKLHIDHIVPYSKGGANTVENLQTLCSECNLGKSNKENISPRPTYLKSDS